MGIRGISTYINQNWRFVEPFHLQNTDLVIDGVNLYCKIYPLVDPLPGLMGAQYDKFYNELRNLLEGFLLCQIRPIVILDSIQSLNKKDHMVKCQDRLAKLVSGKSIGQPDMKNPVFLDVLRDLKIRFVETITEADETMVAVAQALDCPILSQDGDFYLGTTKFIHWDTLNRIPQRVNGSSQYAMECQLYTARKLCNVFRNLSPSVLPLAQVILGDKYGRPHLDADIMQPLFTRIESDLSESETLSKASGFPHRRIENTLNWLSNYMTLDEAITAVLDWVDTSHVSKISRDIKNFISELGVSSPLAFTALGLPERIVSELRAGYEKKMMSKEVEQQSEPGDLEFTEEKIIEMSPKWMIEGLTKGRIEGLPFQLLMFSTAFLFPTHEHPVYPPSGFISLPILKLTYSIVCSLRENNENVLEIYSFEGKEIIREEVTVPTSSISLKDIKSLGIPERKRIIDEVLGVDGDDSLQELPACWRLYTAAVVFWMRQTIPPERTRHHVSSVVLMMVLGVIDDKIGFLRSKEAFLKKYEAQHQEIISRPKPNHEMKGLNLRETLKAVTKEECIAAASFFISKLETVPPGSDWRTIVYTFAQLHCCLTNTFHLNSIVAYPYHPIPLHRVYNGLLFSKMYQISSKQDDTEAYLHAQLEYSPAIVAVFSKLKDLILSMIEMR